MSSRPSALITLLILTVCYAVGFVGAMAINSAIGFWYIAQNKPLWAVPNWSLVPIWLALHALIGGAIASVWPDEDEPKHRAWAIGLLGVVLSLNAVWAVLFFGVHRALPAFVAACLLWPIVLAATIFAWRVREFAGRVLVPILLWATYALALTGAVWRLNR